MRSHVFINTHFKKTSTPPILLNCRNSRVLTNSSLFLEIRKTPQLSAVSATGLSPHQAMLAMHRPPTALLQTAPCDSWTPPSSDYRCPLLFCFTRKGRGASLLSLTATFSKDFSASSEEWKEALQYQEYLKDVLHVAI